MVLFNVLLSQILLAALDDDALVVLAHLLASQVVHGVVKVNVSVNVVDAIDIVLIGNHYPFVRNDSPVGSDDVAFLFVVVVGSQVDGYCCRRPSESVGSEPT